MPSDRQPKGGPLSRWLSMPNDSTAKTIAVALILCLVCSVVVSSAAVMLKPLQTKNRMLDRQINILDVAGLWHEGVDVSAAFDNIEAHVVDLASGEDVMEPSADQYDQRRAAGEADMSIALDANEDIAGIGRRANLATVYHVKEGDELQLIILPVHGYGLWSTLYGFLALEPDGQTIYGIKFYEHAETPGLGGDDPSSPHEIDGLAGATLTGNGVTNLVRFWMGELGFAKYLQRFSKG
jgi:Na+-transporting NADH:ubiquinone oxidoreductase subunit C